MVEVGAGQLRRQCGDDVVPADNASKKNGQIVGCGPSIRWQVPSAEARASPVRQGVTPAGVVGDVALSCAAVPERLAQRGDMHPQGALGSTTVSGQVRAMAGLCGSSRRRSRPARSEYPARAPEAHRLWLSSSSRCAGINRNDPKQMFSVQGKCRHLSQPRQRARTQLQQRSVRKPALGGTVFDVLPPMSSNG